MWYQWSMQSTATSATGLGTSTRGDNCKLGFAWRVSGYSHFSQHYHASNYSRNLIHVLVQSSLINVHQKVSQKRVALASLKYPSNMFGEFSSVQWISSFAFPKKKQISLKYWCSATNISSAYWVGWMSRVPYTSTRSYTYIGTVFILWVKCSSFVHSVVTYWIGRCFPFPFTCLRLPD